MAKFNDADVDFGTLPAIQAPIQIFDVDYTITKHSTGVMVARYGVQHGFVSRMTIIRFPFYYLRYMFGKYTVENLPKRLDPLAGFKKETLLSWSKEAFERDVADDMFEEAIELVKLLQKNGKTIILCTSSLDFIVRPLADHLGIEHVLTTELEMKDGISTGGIVGMPSFGSGKLVKSKHLVEKLGFKLSQCAFWTDSINDLPLLKEVGFPVPTNPDKRLKQASKEAGWDVLTLDR